jgi:hypothetical protein
MARTVTVHLNGGLGNQMFQYAAGRGLVARTGADLVLDNRSGFARDKVYKRTYELDAFPIAARLARPLEIAPLVFEAARQKFVGAAPTAVSERVYGSYLLETRSEYMPEIASFRPRGDAWMRGYWQSEQYFSDCGTAIRDELTPPPPTARHFLAAARHMATVNSVAVGVRLFEEVPGAAKTGVGGLTPIAFFNAAARQLSATVPAPEFFVFCTTDSPQLRTLDLPGPLHLITHDHGFEGSLDRLWLLTQCRHHLIANSSFYWWGAWLRDARAAGTQVIASPLFPNRDTIPGRWASLDVAGLTDGINVSA